MSPFGAGSSAGPLVVQEIHVGVDPLIAGLAEGEDPQRNPRVVGRDRDVDRRAVADRLAALRGRIRVEHRREEDRRPLGVEIEHLGRIRRQPEAVVLGPAADLVGTAAQDGDVERVDADLHQHLCLVAGGAGGEDRGLRDRLGLADEALEGPVAALLDLRRDPGEWRERPERPAAAGELERGDVVLLAVVVARQRRRAEQVDRAVRPDQPAAGQHRRSPDCEKEEGREARSPESG